MSELQHHFLSEIKNMANEMRRQGIFEEDDPLLSQSFIEGETEIPNLIESILNSIDEDNIRTKGLAALIAEYGDRRARFEKRIESKRGLIELALMRFEINKVETQRATVSLRRTPRKLANLDEAEIPSEYYKPQPPKLDRSKLISDLKDGKQVAGANLDNGGVTLAIRKL